MKYFIVILSILLVAAVYFLFDSLCHTNQSESVVVSTIQPKATIMGIVTFQQEEQPSRPDYGSHVYICPLPDDIDSLYCRNLSILKIRYYFDKTSLTDIFLSQDEIEKKKYRFEIRDSIMNGMIEKIKSLSVVPRSDIIVDNIGKYSTRLIPGNYVVIIQSNHLTYNSMTEIHGLIEIDCFHAKPDEEYHVNAEFMN